MTAPKPSTFDHKDKATYVLLESDPYNHSGHQTQDDLGPPISLNFLERLPNSLGWAFSASVTVLSNRAFQGW